MNRFIHSCSRYQPSGRCRVRWPRPCRAVRGHVDQVTADRDAAGVAVGEAGQGAGGAEQVAADGGEREPGGVGGEITEGRCASGPSVQPAKTCSA